MMRGRFGLLVVAGALLGAAAVWLVSPAIRQSVQSLFRKGDAPVAVLGDAPASSGPVTAEDHLADTPLGLVVRPGIAASAGNRPVFVDEVISGYSTESATAVPAEITTIRPVFGCLLTKPMPGTLVGHATAGISGMPVGMVTYGDPHLATGVVAFVEGYRRLGDTRLITMTGPSYEAYDVVVTDITRPVYLVLESRGGNRLWNIHVAEGGRIERVVLLGGDQAGVANLDAVVPVEVILNPGLAECGIVPAYAPSLGQIADSSDAEGQQPMAQGGIDAALAQAETYDIWFRDSFDLLAGESRVGFDQGTVSVIGPVPGGEAPKAIWASIDGADIRTTHDRFLDLAGQAGPGEDFAGRVLAIVTGFALGDLESLRLGGAF